MHRINAYGESPSTEMSPRAPVGQCRVNRRNPSLRIRSGISQVATLHRRRVRNNIKAGADAVRTEASGGWWRTTRGVERAPNLKSAFHRAQRVVRPRRVLPECRARRPARPAQAISLDYAHPLSPFPPRWALRRAAARHSPRAHLRASAIRSPRSSSAVRPIFRTRCAQST
jgi:hypothetical protein